ncbi:MAG: hypothetical protein ACETWM_01430 [Candidatus Lokiarchaeia archaeon]
MRQLKEEINEKGNRLLKSICKIVSEIFFSIHSVNKDVASKLGQSFEKYEFGYLIETFQNSAEIVSTLVLFFENYIDGIVKGLEFFSNLVFALGIKEYSKILSEKNKLEEFIQPDRIDLGFLKFQLRTTEELIFPQLEIITAKTLEKFDHLREMPGILKSDILDTFIEEIEKQKSDWNKIQNKIRLCFSIVEKEKDISTCVNQISEVIYDFVIFGANLRNLVRHLTYIMGDKLELSMENISKIAEIIKQLKQDLIILVNCRAKEAEFIAGSFIQILTMLWGSVEKARQKFQSFIKSQISLDDLIPPSFSYEDLKFGLVQARNQILLVDTAHKRVVENVEAMRVAAEYLNSPVLGEQYEIIVKEIEIVNKYWPGYTQNLIELQHLLHEKIISKSK